MEILKNYVKEGGELLITFHDSASYQNVKEMLSVFSLENLNISVKEDEGFENSKIQNIVFKKDLAGFLAQEKYEFYSRYYFDLEGCDKQKEGSCYVQSFPFEKGKILVMSGVPFFSNALLSKANHSNWVYRFMSSRNQILIDEYSHYLSDYTFSNLMEKSFFAIPFYLMVLIVFLFFFFSKNPQSILRAREQKNYSPSFHDFSEKYLLYQTQTKNLMPSLLSEQISYLQKKFPEYQEKLKEYTKALEQNFSPKQGMQMAIELSLFHQQI